MEAPGFLERIVLLTSATRDLIDLMWPFVFRPAKGARKTNDLLKAPKS